jgi:DNA-binding MurR/RpiR family transcriptional regulator
MMTVTAEYLAGIKDGRKIFKAEGIENAADRLNNLNLTIASGFGASNPVGQYLRGERDFWRNQIKKAKP